MYSGLESRNAQMTLLTLSAEAELPKDHSDIILAFMTAIIRPAMRERDKLAHWIWGHSDDLPDALLLSAPKHMLKNLMKALREAPGIEAAAVHSNFDEVFVIRSGYMDGIISRLSEAKDHLRVAMATVWTFNSAASQSEYLQQLSNVPQIQEALLRAQGRQKTHEVLPPAPR